MKVLYLHNVPIDSHFANLLQVKSMCKAMALQGMDVILSLPANGLKYAHQKYTNDLYEIILRNELINNKKIDKYINYNSVKKTIKNVNPDLIYIRSPILIKQAISSNRPIVVELHNYQLHQGYSFINNYWKRFLRRKSKSDQFIKFICISNALRDFWVEQGLPAEKIITAHDAIDEQQFPRPISISEARKRLGFSNEKKIITYLGRIYKNRRIDAIIELAAIYSNTLFLVVGGPDNEADYMRKISEKKELNNIMFTGQVPHNEITSYLYASDVLLALWSSKVRTINYCSPLKLFEYMGAGRIIVAHGFPTILEILEHNYNAIISEPDSINDLIEKVGYALELNYPNSLAENARNDVFEHYTWTKRVDKIFYDISKS